MSDYGLVPDYTDVDFQTLTARLKVLLSKTDTFKDYDFEGANITLIMELLAYIGDLNTFYTNRLAQNIHPDTADIYEVVHSLSREQGYVPTGYISSEVTLTVRVIQRSVDQSVTYFNVGDQLLIPQWFKINTGLIDDNNYMIYYCIPEDFTFDVTADGIGSGYYDDEETEQYNYVEFDVVMKQGEPLQVALEYTGEDIISNQIVLPFEKWDMGLYPYDETLESILVTVGESETAWVRVEDFFDDLSALNTVEDAYIFYYDKYKRAVLSFSNTRNIPEFDDDIKIYLIKSLGVDGVISANTFNENNKPVMDTVLGVLGVPFLTNISSGNIIPSDNYDVSNSSASAGGSDPETIEELKIGGTAYSHSQLRNVTSKDYIGNLESRGDVGIANVWGEQEQNPTTLDSTYFNRVYISLVPTEWITGVDNNIKLVDLPVDDLFSNNTDVDPKYLKFPIIYDNDSVYNPTWQTQLLEFLEPRKMLGSWEEFILPELVYFRFDFGLTVKRSYSWVSVQQAVKNKLIYYFKYSNRSFGEIIDFKEVYNYLVDPSNVTPDDDFGQVRGIQSLVIRDLLIDRDIDRVGLIGDQTSCEYFGGTWTGSCSFVPDEMYIYPDNSYNYYPHFIDTGYTQNTVDDVYNSLQPIQLGYNQFPQLASDFCVFVNEG